MISSQEIKLSTKGELDIIDLTPVIRKKLDQSGVMQGLVTVFVYGSTAAITTLEYEEGVIEDFKQAICRLVPREISYKHNCAWQNDNGHSHVRAALIGPALSIPVINSNLMLGTWQQIILVELDTRPRDRTLFLHFLGKSD